jgi:hypothetical protein
VDASGGPLFRRLLGADFDALPAPIRFIHGGAPRRRFAGRCRVERGTSVLSRILGVLASLPAAGADVSLHVTVEAGHSRETWKREFDGKALRSRFGERDGLLEESMGALGLRYRLAAHARGIDWRPAAVRWLGVPLPLPWFREVRAGETVDPHGVYAFDVNVALPLAGLLVRYRGTLHPAD